MIETHKIFYTDILHDVSVTLSPTCRVAVMGLNGAGKTTLLKLLSGYLKPSQGHITLENRKMTSWTAAAIAQKIAFVPQDFPTDFPFTVKEFILMGRSPWQKTWVYGKHDLDVVIEALEQVNLLGLKDRTVTTLSGGEKQKVLLARSLAQDTPFIFLDEPTNHLDIKNKADFFEKLVRLNEEQGKGIVAVLHDLNDVRAFFSDVIFLKHGKLVYAGPLEAGFTEKNLWETFDTIIDGWQEIGQPQWVAPINDLC